MMATGRVRIKTPAAGRVAAGRIPYMTTTMEEVSRASSLQGEFLSAVTTREPPVCPCSERRDLRGGFPLQMPHATATNTGLSRTQRTDSLYMGDVPACDRRPCLWHVPVCVSTATHSSGPAAHACRQHV